VRAFSSSEASRIAKRIRCISPTEFKSTKPEVDANGIAIATCTATKYNLPQMHTSLKQQFKGASLLGDGTILHARMNEGKSEVFFFSDGHLVLWTRQCDASEILKTVRELTKGFEEGRSLDGNECESLLVTMENGEEGAGLKGETIILKEEGNRISDDGLIGAKLAFSNGLADSVRLAVLEASLEDYIERVKLVPEMLASGKAPPFDRADVLKLTGELLRFRAELNLTRELIDTPEMYWEDPQLEDHYNQITKVLEIRRRAHILNKKLDYANELADVLRTHLSEQHSLNLEWGIIALIAIEVAFETIHYII